MEYEVPENILNLDMREVWFSFRIPNQKKTFYTVEPRYKDPRYNDIPGITMKILCPGKSYSKMYGKEPRYDDLRYNDNPDITIII